VEVRTDSESVGALKNLCATQSVGIPERRVAGWAITMTDDSGGGESGFAIGSRAAGLAPFKFRHGSIHGMVKGGKRKCSSVHFRTGLWEAHVLALADNYWHNTSYKIHYLG
jgi:hypothetical protein